METVRLPRSFDDIDRAAELSAQVRAGEVTLDWSGVEETSPDALRRLTAGLDAAKHADALGAATMSDAVAETVAAAFESAPATKPGKKQRRKAAPKADATPARWKAPEESPPPVPEPPPESQTSEVAPQPPATEPAKERLLTPAEPEEIRAKLLDMLEKDLLGPFGDDDEEILEEGVRVRDRYLVGVVAPRRLQVRPDENDALEVQESDPGEEGTPDESSPSTATLFPSSIGLSFCVDEGAPELVATVSWGWYRREKSETLETEKGNPRTVWRRHPMRGTLRLPKLAQGPIGPLVPCDEQPEVTLEGVCHRAGEELVVSLFLVNGQVEPEQSKDEAWLFQPHVAVEAADGSAVFRRRPLEMELGEEERELAMRYRDRVEFATGHGVSVHATPSGEDPWRAGRVETRVLPAHEVPIQTFPDADEEPLLAGLELDMKVLAEAPRDRLEAMLRPLPDAYADWIRRQAERVEAEEDRFESYRDEARRAIARCERALARIRDGLALLQQHEHAARAFRFANRAMWQQRVRTTLVLRRRAGETVAEEDVDVPGNRSWRTFQLAFVLLNLDSVTNIHHRDRCDPREAIADLLFFPTGGGKTEAYLGLAAYVMGLRRLQGMVAGRSGNHGVAVLMRYTLRLLTIQQFQRATALVCAMERIRIEDDGETWGAEPFRIGLWVGSKTTPNRTRDADQALKQRKVGWGQGSVVGGIGTPVQLRHCPWCGSDVREDDYFVESEGAGRQRTLVYCGDRYGRCAFTRKRSPAEGIPVLVVDEEIYRRLPALLIATVDKFAQMPWNGKVQMLFGRVQAECPRHGFVSPEIDDKNHNRRGAMPATKLRAHSPIRPPDLIIQDELHLISGPLGTLTGLYETAIDELCSWEVGGRRVRPKVIASTATIRQAPEQVHGLFQRRVEVFPPQALDAGDTFFSRERPTEERPGRLYLGVCSPGRRLKSTLIRVYTTLLLGAQRLLEEHGARADPWMALVGYFNSIRELAGMRRLVEDDVRSRARRDEVELRGLRRRPIIQAEELTSRLPSVKIPQMLEWLERTFETPDPEAPRKTGQARPLDVLLATNMISVGVDVQRLALMVVAGQPKATAEYIQATSRIGRRWPGLVLTVYNWARPRDLSHYETFEQYHATFYQHVEALSVTPFSPRALDRGLTALLVSLVRLAGFDLNENAAAEEVTGEHPAVREAIEAIVRRAESVSESTRTADEVRRMLLARKDEWLFRAGDRDRASRLGYETRRDGKTIGLLNRAGGGAWDLFTCLNSLRDVETEVKLVLMDDPSLDREDRAFAGGEA